ncbi:MAG: pilus assembly protein PilV [Euryarchaeota archaeon]|nr:pilus assembly protein PilV [Euryarchaeota archaeon]
MIKKNQNISGLSILEALVSTVIVGIGFVAILQMTNFSVQSIDNSGDRTKANFLTEMIAEDVIGSKNSYFGVNSDNPNIIFNSDGIAKIGDEELDTFTEYLSKSGWSADLSCGGNNSEDKLPETKQNIYDEQNVDAPRNKKAKWDTIFGENRFLKCTNSNEVKKLQVFEICRWDDCDYKLDSVSDDPMYIGRVEMKLNNGKKRKFLYFQTDYKIKQ